ncbi:MAG: thermonuclease family protein [Deltaproteobacteria bacterium]|nr:thermonuclease family protein [Deltaproteobacteria bacterium]
MKKSHPYRFFIHILLFAVLSSALPYPAVAEDAQSKPVTDKLLRTLHLDRRFHKCIAVADGDTITLEDLGTVRFIGVDTPEKNHPMLPAQFMAEEASAFIRKICLGKDIRLEYDGFDDDKRGNYGRILAYLYLEDGTFVQKQLLMKGYAETYTNYPFDEKRKGRFLVWERKAKQGGLGLWKDGGMTEALWILEQKQLLIPIEKVSADNYRLRIGNWSSRIFHKDEVSLSLTKLYSDAHALAPRDLRKQLSRSGYQKTAVPEPASHRVFLMGMAHKKWGIIYRNHVKPRVSATELGIQIQELFRWIKNLDPELLGVVLPVNGYHPVPEELVQAAEKPEIAETFLKSEPIAKQVGRRISWESAGKYIGEHVTVQGTIVRSYNSGKACFLNFHQNFTRYMSLTIFENALRKFPFQPETYYLHKTVRVKGKIKIYKGRPEIVVESPKQIEVVEKN